MVAAKETQEDIVAERIRSNLPAIREWLIEAIAERVANTLQNIESGADES